MERIYILKADEVLDPTVVEELEAVVNEQAGEWLYTEAQVERGLWSFFLTEVERLQESLEENFRKLSDKDKRHYCGFPALSLSDRDRYARGDELFDSHR